MERPHPPVRLPRRTRPSLWCGPLLLLALSGGLSTAQAQLAAVESLAKRITDVSFFASTGGFLPASNDLETGGFGLASYGVELLFEVGRVLRARELPSAPETVLPSPASPQGSEGEGEATEQAAPGQTRWIFEMGVGYGQMSGFRGESRDADLRGVVREIPSVSFYAAYLPVNGYFGVRSGFMKIQGLEYYFDGDQGLSGTAESFLASVLGGFYYDLLGFGAFLETGYALRNFPSISWASGTLPPDIPRSLNLSGWFLSSGIQFKINN